MTPRYLTGVKVDFCSLPDAAYEKWNLDNDKYLLFKLKTACLPATKIYDFLHTFSFLHPHH